MQKIISPIVTEEDFKSAFKCAPDNTASSYSGRGAHHYRACSEGSQDDIEGLIAAVHFNMTTVPLTARDSAQNGVKRL
jgi:hypothetical protein